ncbi:MAG: PLP-dependent aminotransferase family protein [Planctomycetota bacterium]
MKRYEALAARVQGMIQAGTLPAGERLTSVRRMSRQQGVSVSTVTAAYRLLEARGLIEARPQSGYFVRASRCHRVPAPRVSRPSSRARVPQVWEVAQQLAEAARSDALVPLGNADPPDALLPAAGLMRRLRGLGREATRAVNYGNPLGEIELRTQIARRMLQAGCTLDAGDLLITHGCFEAVQLALRATCQPGDAVAVESPVHFILLQMLQVLGLKVVELPAHPRTGLDVDALAPLLERRRVRAVLCTPVFHNPLGAVIPPPRLRELVRLCATHEVPLIEDDVYGELGFGLERPPVAKAYDPDGWVLHCSSFSKTICPGFRVGWIAPGRFADAVRRVKFVTNFVTATPLQLALSAFLRDGAYERAVRRASRSYATTALRCRDAVARHFPSGTTVSDPQGGMVLWVGLPEGVDGAALYASALEAGISVVPGHMFSAQGRFRNYVRLAFPHPWSDALGAAVAELGRLATGLLPS